jgi:hypothetical protein
MFSTDWRPTVIMQLTRYTANLRTALVIVFTAPQCLPALAAECVTTSGDKRVALLELYTSEGCSSCPPADRWLSALTAEKTVPAAMLPLAFHVDYWNDIGWVDPYSQARFSDRQRQYSRRRGVGFVVTPQFLLDGQPYQRPLIFNDLNGKTQAINRTSPRAAIRISESRLPLSISAQIDARVAEPALRDAELFVAVFENNLQSAVTSGENAGTLLKHDFVVRELGGPVAIDANGHASHRISVRPGPSWKLHDLRLAAFVQHPRSGQVLQAVGSDCR